MALSLHEGAASAVVQDGRPNTHRGSGPVDDEKGSAEALTRRLVGRGYRAASVLRAVTGSGLDM